MEADRGPVRVRVREHEDEAVDRRVAALQFDATLERLHVAQPRLQLRPRPLIPADDHEIPGAQVAGYRHGDLRQAAERRADTSDEPPAKVEVRPVAERRPGGIELDREIE